MTGGVAVGLNANGQINVLKSLLKLCPQPGGDLVRVLRSI